MNQDNQQNNQNERYIRIRSLLISLKTDVLAVASVVIAFLALLMSGGVMWVQIQAALLGPRVLLQPPNQIFIFRDETGPDKKVRLNLGADLVYINSGDKGYDGILLKEVIKFPVGSKTFEFGWHKFGQFEGGPGDLNLAKERPALPIVLAAGTAATHQTYFVPWPIDCSADTTGTCNQLGNHVYWNDFIGYLKSLTKAGKKEYVFHFVATLHDENPVKTSCKIILTDKIVDAIAQLSSYNPTCYPTP